MPVVGMLQALGFTVVFATATKPDLATDISFRSGMIGLGNRTFVETWVEDGTRWYRSHRIQFSVAQGRQRTNSPVFADGLALLVWVKTEGWI